MTKVKTEHLIVGLLTVQVLLLAILFIHIRSLETSLIRALEPTSNSVSAMVENVLPGDSVTKGPNSAPVTVIEFSDFQCLYCAQAAPEVAEIMDKYPGQVKFVYRHFPLEGAHPDAMKAALAAECAREQDSFWDMHDILFTNRNNLDEASLNEYAEKIGLDMTDFNICLSSRRYEEKIQNDISDGRSYGVQGTPTFFVNGRRMTGFVSDNLETLIKEALADIQMPASGFR